MLNPRPINNLQLWLQSAPLEPGRTYPRSKHDRQRKTYLNRGKRNDLEPLDAENEGCVPVPFAEDDADPGQEQTMSWLDDALQGATAPGEFIEVDDPYEGDSDAPGEPS